MISINLSSVIRSYVNIVIDYTNNSKSEREKLSHNKYTGKLFTRKNILRLILNFFINLTVTSIFIYIDNGYNFLLFVFLIEALVRSIKPYIKEDFFSFFYNALTKYLHCFFTLNIPNISTCNFGVSKVIVPREADPQHSFQDNALIFLQQVAGGISVPNGAKHDIYLFNNMMDMHVPLWAPSYIRLSPEQRVYHMNMLLALDAREKAHGYIVESLSRIIGNLGRVINPDIKTFAHLPQNVRHNIFRTLELSYTFTPACRVPPISDNLTVTDLRHVLSTLKVDNDKPYRSMSNAIVTYQEGFCAGYRNNNNIAAQAIRAHKYNVVARAKFLKEG